MIRLDKRTAVSMLRAKANAEPERIAKCVYVIGDKAECIVGQILCDLKPELMPFLKENKNKGIGGDEFRKELATFGITFTKGAVDVLTEAQQMQDLRYTWKQSVDTACYSH